MAKKLIILCIVLALATGVYAVKISPAVKRKVAQVLPFAPTPPVADGTINAIDRAVMAGVCSLGADRAHHDSGEASRRSRRW